MLFEKLKETFVRFVEKQLTISRTSESPCRTRNILAEERLERLFRSFVSHRIQHDADRRDENHFRRIDFEVPVDDAIEGETNENSVDQPKRQDVDQRAENFWKRKKGVTRGGGRERDAPARS